MKIVLGDLTSKVGGKHIFKPTTGNESLHAISNDNGIRVVNFATSKNLTVKRHSNLFCFNFLVNANFICCYRAHRI
jgi:hypothetical protein